MSGSKDRGNCEEADEGAAALFTSSHSRRSHPWDLYRQSILEIAKEELPKSASAPLVERLDREVGRGVWQLSPTAVLATGVAFYKQGKEKEARRALEEAWDIWEGLLDAEDPQCDSPVEILFVLRDLMRSTGQDEGSPAPTHFRVRAAYQRIAEDYGNWTTLREEWSPDQDSDDPLRRFAAASLLRARSNKKHHHPPMTLDP